MGKHNNRKHLQYNQLLYAHQTDHVDIYQHKKKKEKKGLERHSIERIPAPRPPMTQFVNY